jgi:hypothetical protein
MDPHFDFHFSAAVEGFMAEHAGDAVEDEDARDSEKDRAAQASVSSARKTRT